MIQFVNVFLEKKIVLKMCQDYFLKLQRKNIFCDSEQIFSVLKNIKLYVLCFSLETELSSGAIIKVESTSKDELYTSDEVHNKPEKRFTYCSSKLVEWVRVDDLFVCDWQLDLSPTLCYW